MLSHEQIRELFLDHLNNAIDAPFELAEGMVYNKERSKNIGSGLELTVHSNDHDTHFHIKHQGRGINAVFTYPSITFMGYRNKKGTFSSKELKNIITTCNIPMYRQFIEGELKKRDA